MLPFPLVVNVFIQSLDSSARNSLICMGLTDGLDGLRAGFRELVGGRSGQERAESGPERPLRLAAKSAGLGNSSQEHVGIGAIRQEKTTVPHTRTQHAFQNA